MNVGPSDDGHHPTVRVIDFLFSFSFLERDRGNWPLTTHPEVTPEGSRPRTSDLRVIPVALLDII